MSNGSANAAGIAIVGMAGRFPGARNLDEFWRNLCDGVESISFFSDEELAEARVTVPDGNHNVVKARAVLEDADLFDAAFFGMNPKEAELTDPQHRLFLECAWQALENANCDPSKFGGAIGVFAGMSTNTYLAHNLNVSPALTIGSNGEFQAMLGNEHDYLTSRVSYKLNLRGPSLNIQTACSTSLVAVSVACQHLLTYQCDMALAGAVSVSFPQKRGYLYQEGGITSPDGHCRPFDANSAGTVAGEGVGVVALKRLEDALKDGDAVYAVIKGFATNNDGSLKIGYTAPSVEGQADVVAMAQAMAGFEPETISYIEAHGTGTPLGDPIEIEGLTRAFRLGTNAKNFCAIGSVKGNIGHLDTAAGMAGLIKTALALHHRRIPASLHFVAPNPKIIFASSPFRVNQALTEWQDGPTPRRAGVSSFGIGGTNAHVVLEEAPGSEISGVSRPVQLLLLSARTKTALAAAAKNLAHHLTQHPQASLADVAHTLQTGRRAFEQRAVVTSPDLADAAATLESFDAARVFTGSPQRENPPIVFMFPGQGAQHVNMGRQLYETEPVFRSTVDHCGQLLEPQLGLDLRTLLFPAPAQIEAATQRLKETAFTQPAMFVVEYALAQLWMSWGVQPAAMIGHSLGEYVAACVAEVFSLNDALTLIAARGRMMQALPAGGMLAVRLSESEVKPLLRDDIALAAVNAASGCVVSGPFAALETFQRQLAERSIGSVALQTSHAFHSAMMEPILAPFAELVQSIKRQPPKIPFISNVTGTWITDAQAVDPAYWAAHLRQTVRFADGLNELFKADRLFLEVGPGQILSGLARQHSARPATTPVITSFGHTKAEASELETMLDALGQLWISGVTPAWEKFYAGEKRRRVWLPTYPFERKRHWVEPARTKLPQPAGLSADEVHAPRNGAGKTGSTGSVHAAVAIEHRRVPLAESPTRARLCSLIGQLSGLDTATLDGAATFTQLGFESLFLTQASVAIERDFGVRVAFRQLVKEFSTLDTLAAHLDRSLSGQERPARHGNGAPHKNGVVERDSLPSDFTARVALTEGQRELWFAAQMSDGASCAYNECRLLDMRGLLQPEALFAALQQLVDRHEALRTTILPDGKFQQIHPALKLAVPLADWREAKPEDCAARLHAVQAEEARQSFDLIRGPLLRARLIRRGETHHVLVLTVHHVICDGYSFGVLLRDLAKLYSKAAGGTGPELESPLQFSRYVGEQELRHEHNGHAAAETYWLKQFADAVPVLELPADHPRPAEWRFEGAREFHALPAELGRQLKRTDAAHGGTLFSTLLAGYALWLHRWTGQEDIVIGVPIADRAVENGDTLVGHCVSFLPIRIQVSPDATWNEHVARVQETFLNAHEHRHCTFGSLMQKLNLPREANRMPLTTVTFNMDRLGEPPKFFGLETVLADNAHSSTSFDLGINLTETNGRLELDCRYSTSLFAAGTIRRWLGHFQTLLAAAVANPHEQINRLPLLAADERQRVLVEWNNTAADYSRDQCVHQLFEDQAARTPDAVAVLFNAEPLTYARLNAEADRLAQKLTALGVGPDVPVGICLPRSLEMMVGVLGILKAGGAYVPLDPAHPKERLRRMIENTRAPVLLTRHEPAADLNFGIPNLKLVGIEPLTESGAAALEAPRKSDVTSGHLAYIIHTSGSTGVPKGVAMGHRALVNLISWQVLNAKISPTARTLQFAPLSFDVSFQEMFSTWAAGGTLVLCGEELRRDPVALWRLLTGQKVERLFLPFVALQQLAEAAGEQAGPASLREVITAGEALQITPKIVRLFERLKDCTLHNHYGPTESHVVTAFTLSGPPGRWPKLPPIGRPIANVRIYVLDAHLQPVPEGVPGELFIGGDCLAQGYFNRPDLTAERFVRDPFSSDPAARLYQTGDLARWLPEGRLEFRGRMDQQMKIRGYRVEPGEIESVLAGHPAVHECAVVAGAGTPGEQRLVAYLVQKPGVPAASQDDLRAYLETKLPAYMVPGAWVHLKALPLTASGKVDRCSLPAPEASRPGREETFAAPETPAEEALAEIWREVLGLRHIGRHDNFFALGGHSLLMTQVLSRVREAFQAELPMRRFFEGPTISALAAAIEELLVEEISRLSDDEAKRLVQSAEYAAL